MAVACLAVILFALPLVMILRRSADDQATLRLERSAVAASRELPAVRSTGSTQFAYYDRRARLVRGAGPAVGDVVVRRALADRVTQAEVPDGRVTAIPVVSDGRIVGALRAAQPTSVTERDADRLSLLLAALAIGVLGVGLAVGSVVAGRLVRPLLRMRDDAVRLGKGDFRIHPSPSGIGEIDDAQEALSATAARLEDLVVRERSFSADASHQLRTPLAALRTSLETELAFPEGDPCDAIRAALDEVGRLEATIDDLLEHARRSNVEAGNLDVGALLAGVHDRWDRPVARAGRTLAVEGVAALPEARGSEPLLRQALDCLLDNAVRHGAGTITVAARVTDSAVTVTVADEGEGFSPGEASVDESGPHGLGLPLVRRLVEASGGRFVIADPGPAPRLEIVLLRAEPAAGPEPSDPDLAKFSPAAARPLADTSVPSPRPPTDSR